MSEPIQERILKRDLFGTIAEVQGLPGRAIRRDTRSAAFGLRWLARWLAGREARALQRLQGVPAVPRLLCFEGGVLERSHLGGEVMYRAAPRELAYYREARRLLQAVHRRGVVHNDLAKEANWLQLDDGRPALVDFQIAWIGRPRAPLMRLLAREDLRHLLKHKRMYCPQHLTPVEKRLLKRQSWIRRLWFATGKRIYRFLTRRVLGWRDREGGSY
ncbi:MAG: serine/threonine protein kinase [Aquimonas sp.]|nr:serine/threonine protein kinase [Aquimonas sp.]